MKILVTGGAGYVGSHMVQALVEAQHHVAVIDDLSAGHEDAVPAGVPLVRADVRDADVVRHTLNQYAIEAIFHFASRIQVGESVVRPRLYYRDNLVAAVDLLDVALDAGVRRFILSSTAAVYGNPILTPIEEEHPTSPANPYGETKLAVERMLASYSKAYGLSFAALRYFNAAGAYHEAGLGERHDPETHLIPILLECASGTRSHVTVFGDDYPTRDGTCVRDYVHVRDLADAHLAALQYLNAGGQSGAFNLGTGVGYSVREVIDVARRVSGRDIRVEHGTRRPGDPPELVASPRKANEKLGWSAKRSSLERIMSDAWQWHRSRPATPGGNATRGKTPAECGLTHAARDHER